MSKVYKDEERTIRALCPLAYAQPTDTGADYYCTTECAWCVPWSAGGGYGSCFCGSVAKRGPILWGEDE